ncbi:histidine phosphatase family protein [Ramlibacter sp. 2FC]|uniref:SixA phosphatase family protein n=1 Tax=Ramlibacter sp. 2FC TaxID=2502188 RepID=UPI0010FA58B4|nr:histidine phosphatase family protein [Ramlibacter sp. 2FC]
MDLILWRHAEANDAGMVGDDLARSLTPRGEKQAARMAAWLDRQLPEGVRVLASPARRTEQTAMALDRRYKLRAELAPGAAADDVLAAVGWPDGKSAVLVVGHQPTLGQVVARLLGLPSELCSVRKGAVWWLRSRERDGQLQTVLLTVQSPELL